MYTLYKFHFLNGISEINQLFDDILIIWPAPVYSNWVEGDSSMQTTYQSKPIKLTQPGVTASYKLLNICMGQLGKKGGSKKQSKFIKRP